MEESKTRDKCQICGQNTHVADRCPFSYTVCPQPNCNGIRILQTSQAGWKFLKCQHSSCIGFEWLDVAILKANGKGGCSSSGCSSSSVTACFSCEETTYWMDDCPWKENLCPTLNCNGTMFLKRSGSILNPQRLYLKCEECQKFQLFNDAKDENERNVAATARLLGIDDICSKLTSNMNMK